MGKRLRTPALDQGHEQNNDSGGAEGLTENPVAFRRWMVAGPGQARLIEEFEVNCLEDNKSSIKRQQHEEALATQKKFKKQVVSLCATVANIGNPFIDDCPELLALDSRNCASADVVHTVRNIEIIEKPSMRNM